MYYLTVPENSLLSPQLFGFHASRMAYIFKSTINRPLLLIIYHKYCT